MPWIDDNDKTSVCLHSNVIPFLFNNDKITNK